MKDNIVIYWDTSAIVSAIFKDIHSEIGLQYLTHPGVHLISTLGVAETYAVIYRMQREGHIEEKYSFSEVVAIFEEGPWRGINSNPSRKNIKDMAKKWPLRGADLWHLATAKTLLKDLPELKVLTFDQKLLEATIGERLDVRFY